MRRWGCGGRCGWRRLVKFYKNRLRYLSRQTINMFSIATLKLSCLAVCTVLLLTSCSYVAHVPYLIAAGPFGNDTCRDSHPVVSYILSCPTPLWYDDEKYGPYDPVTTQNANQIVNGRCFLEMAAINGNQDVLRNLIAKGAKPEKCPPGLEQRITSGLIGGACRWFPITKGRSVDVGGILTTLEEIGVKSSPQQILALSCHWGCSAGVQYALSKGADPKQVMFCKVPLPQLD